MKAKFNYLTPNECSVIDVLLSESSKDSDFINALCDRIESRLLEKYSKKSAKPSNHKEAVNTPKKPILKETHVEAYLAKAAFKAGLDLDTAKNLYDFYKRYPTAAINVALKEIAIELDKKYPDHISEAKDIYIISIVDGRIWPLDKSRIQSYRGFAAFRSYEDADLAREICKPLLELIFGEQED